MTDRGWAWLIVLVLVAMVLGGGNCCVNGCAPGYSDGERSGTVWKFSRKGLIAKSWEGELNMGGFHMSGGKDATLVPNVFEFSVVDDAAAKKVDVAQRSGKRVTLKYRQWFWSPWRLDSDSEIIDVAEEVTP